MDEVVLDASRVIAEVTRFARIVIPENGLGEKLDFSRREGRPLRVKMGFDPTSPDLHLGHAVSMRVLKVFQDHGHLPVIIIGDFTGRIGDPSGQNRARPLVDAAEIERNARTYIDQLGRVLDIDKIEVRRNSDWLGPMNVTEVISMLSHGTLAQVASREDFRKRLDAGQPVALHEIIYPYLQGYDSVAVEADIEVGGVDQLYAFQAARQLQDVYGQAPECTVLMSLLRGLDGAQKMSKTLGNVVTLNASPEEMFGKLMSIPDTLLAEYLLLASAFSAAEVDSKMAEVEAGRNPMELKLELAGSVTEMYHGPGGRRRGRGYFDRAHRQMGEPDYEVIPVLAADRLSTLLVAIGAAKSKSAARRLIEQGGVYLGEERVEADVLFQDPAQLDRLRLRVGKRRRVELRLAAPHERLLGDRDSGRTVTVQALARAKGLGR